MPVTRSISAVRLAMEYAERAAAGDKRICRTARLACARHLGDLERWKAKDAPFYFDEKAAERVCDIVQRFPHIHGQWAKEQQRIRLEGWQAFVLTSIFGWKARATDARRFRVVYIEVPRKNAKSTLTSAVGLYLLACDGEHGGHIVSAANTREQAKLVFSDAQFMARKEQRFLAACGIEVLAHRIVQMKTESKFEALSHEHSNLDGLNLHAALIDELHAHSSRELWDVLATATASRQQPLIWAITTAGVNRASVCYDQHSYLLDIVNGHKQDDSYFGIIYALDEGDDPWSEEAWEKCNPNYGVSVLPDGLRQEAKLAMQMPSAQGAFFTKHLNVWINAATSWLPAGAWEKCADPDIEIEDFANEPCWIGVDLAFRSDICALVIAFPPNGSRDWWAIFGRYYLPEVTCNKSENSHYQAWESAGRIITSPGPTNDLSYIVSLVDDIATRYRLEEIAIDPHEAGTLVNDIEKATGFKRTVEIRQTATNLGPPMVELEALVLNKRIRHDGDPVLAWMMSNTKIEYRGDLVKPTKESNEKKIDGVVALLMCIHRAALNAKPRADYEERGLWTI